MSASRVLKFLLPLLILAVGAGAAKALMSKKTTAEHKAPEPLVAAVEYIDAVASNPAARLEATGTVEGERQVSLSALVAGEVVFTSPSLVPGGRFHRGETLLRVDPRDYELVVDQEESRVQGAEVDLSLEEQRGETARREWELLGGGQDASSAPLALRGPQLAAAQSVLKAAKAGLERARLNLERATLKAPFNALVVQENVEVGQLLAPGTGIVSLVGTDRFRVKVTLGVEHLEHVSIPGIGGAQGSSVRVVQRLGDGGTIERVGRVTGLAAQLDPGTRTAELFVAIDDPLAGGGLPLLPGAFVTAWIDGPVVPGAIAVPRPAVVDGNSLWTVTAEDRLQKKRVAIGWQDGDVAFVIGGLEGGERVVITPPSLPVEGALVRPRPVGEAAAQAVQAPSTAPSEG